MNVTVIGDQFIISPKGCCCNLFFQSILSMIEDGLVEGSSHGEALGSVFNHGRDLGDLDSIPIKLEVKVDVLDKATQVVTLEI